MLKALPRDPRSGRGIDSHVGVFIAFALGDVDPWGEFEVFDALDGGGFDEAWCRPVEAMTVASEAITQGLGPQGTGHHHHG